MIACVLVIYLSEIINSRSHTKNLHQSCNFDTQRIFTPSIIETKLELTVQLTYMRVWGYAEKAAIERDRMRETNIMILQIIERPANSKCVVGAW